MRLFRALAVWPVMFIVACASTPKENGSGPTSLAGTKWQLVSFQSSDDAIGTLRPAAPDQYTMAFNADGRVALKLDCNRGSGKWTSSGPGMLSFGPAMMTRAACPEGSLDTRMARDLGNIRSYVLQGDTLTLSLMADGGTYSFRRTAQ